MAGLTPAEFNARVAELEAWYHNRANTMAALTVPKAMEYGSVDLLSMGKSLISIFRGTNERDISDKEAFEVGIFFYIKGKMARWEAALRRGGSVSDDTLFDIGVYVSMIERAREVGAWPFADSHSSDTWVKGEETFSVDKGAGVKVDTTVQPTPAPIRTDVDDVDDDDILDDF